MAERVQRILLPFAGTEISQRALDAALRLARAEGATLMPAYLASVPKRLPLDCPIPAEAELAMPLLETIEQRAMSQGVPVDSRIERGRSYRHALARLLERESFDRVVVPAGVGDGGLSAEDLVWVLDRTGAEVLILRPALNATCSARAAAPERDGGGRGRRPRRRRRDRRSPG